jgi:hypothetical protein
MVVLSLSFRSYWHTKNLSPLIKLFTESGSFSVHSRSADLNSSVFSRASEFLAPSSCAPFLWLCLLTVCFELVPHSC